jgi:hypothetical protein
MGWYKRHNKDELLSHTLHFEKNKVFYEAEQKTALLSLGKC